MQLPDLSLFLIVALFWATYLVLRVFLVKPLESILAGREAAIAGAEAALQAGLEREREALARMDERFTAERVKILAARDAARAEASRVRHAALEVARDKVKAEAAGAIARLEADAQAAQAALETDARRIAADLATQVLGRKVA